MICCDMIKVMERTNSEKGETAGGELLVGWNVQIRMRQSEVPQEIMNLRA